MKSFFVVVCLQFTLQKFGRLWKHGRLTDKHVDEGFSILEKSSLNWKDKIGVLVNQFLIIQKFTKNQSFDELMLISISHFFCHSSSENH